VSAISSGRVGAIVVMDNDMVVGIITDGDVRRALEKRSDIQNIQAKNIMSVNPQTIQGGALAVEAFRKMEEKSITQLVVVNPQNQFLGVVHIHDLLREGIF
jgi:arabinose-5-phosphate isomerase